MRIGHLFVLFVALLSIALAFAQPSRERLRKLREIINNQPIWPRGVPREIAAAIREVRRLNGCDINLCFAIDGSKKLGRDYFNLQLDFLYIVTAIVGADERARFSGVQYGLRNRVIRNIKGNARDFLLDIEQVRWLRSRRSFIGAGVSYCVEQLNRRRGEPARMVIFGDGRSSYGRLSGPLGPAAIARRFRARAPSNAAYAVAVGFSRTELFTKITGDSSKVLKVTEWEKVFFVLAELVRDICAVEPPFRG